MSKLDTATILEDLEQYNDELTLEQYQSLTLINYNNQFRKKLITSLNSIENDETSCLENIENISNILHENKEQLNKRLEINKQINLNTYEEHFTSHRETYDKEIKEINDEINSLTGNLDKEITSITSATYYKKLDIIQTNSDYEKYLFDIKQNYLNSLAFFHDRKESRLISLDDIAKRSKSDLAEKLRKIEVLFENGTFIVGNEDKDIKIDAIKKLIDDCKNKILNRNILIDSQIEAISSKYNFKLELEVTPIKSHIAYLKQELQVLKQTLNEQENKILDSFKLNLQIIDKQLLSNKNKTTKRIDEIKPLLASNPKLQLEIAELEHTSAVLNESMRAKKIEYDIRKDHETNLLILKYNKEKDNIERKITIYQERINKLEGINNFNEYIQFGDLRKNLEIEEIKIKNEIDNLSQKIHLVEAIDKLNTDSYNSLQNHQKELNSLTIEYNDTYFKTIKNKFSTLTGLEIEKSLILKNYNVNTNELLVKKNAVYLKMINDEEKKEGIIKKIETKLKRDILSQDIQFSNKKFDNLKKLSLLEKDYNDRNLINEHDYKLQIKNYNVFETRFQIEKHLYKFYFENMKNFISTIELYFNKYNDVTKCNNKNISFATFKYLTSFLQTTVISLLNKTINAISNRITFESTVNFQYELNRLISEKENNERTYNESVSKINETSNNYENTISLHNDKIIDLERNDEVNKNAIILKELEISYCDIKNQHLIRKLQHELAILIENSLETNKEIKSYKELISKNKKAIIEFDKHISLIKQKYTKLNNSISNELTLIERRHKQESSIYYNFISKLESLIKDINQEFDITDTKDQVYSYFKKYTTSIYSSIVSFETNDIGVLFNKLSKRHDLAVKTADENYNDLVDITKQNWLNDSKRLANSYSEQIYELEKNIEKFYLQFERKIKETNNNHRERINSNKNKIKEIEIEQNRKKGELLYDLNSFVENMDEYTTFTDKEIIKLKNKRSELTKQYFEYNSNLNKEKEQKTISLEKQSENVIISLNNTYNSIVEEKEHTFNIKKHSYKSRIDELKKVFLISITQFNLDESTSQTEYSLEVKNLDKKLDNDLYSLKKSSLSKISKEIKKFNKDKKINDKI